MSIPEKILEVQERIRRSAQKARRDPSSIKLVLVTKTVSVPRILEAYNAGIRDFGENRVQELLEKAPQLPPGIRWHFIGRLQTNKVKHLLGLFPRVGAYCNTPLLIHSLDRLELAEALQEEAEKKGLEVNALVQVNTSGEAAKAGFSPEEAESGLAAIREMTLNEEQPRIRVQGFMTIGPLTGDVSAVRKSFRLLRELKDRTKKGFSGEEPVLSMGMSSDFEIAIEEGATIVRIGSAVFGEKNEAE